MVSAEMANNLNNLGRSHGIKLYNYRTTIYLSTYQWKFYIKEIIYNSWTFSSAEKRHKKRFRFAYIQKLNSAIKHIPVFYKDTLIFCPKSATLLTISQGCCLCDGWTSLLIIQNTLSLNYNCFYNPHLNKLHYLKNEQSKPNFMALNYKAQILLLGSTKLEILYFSCSKYFMSLPLSYKHKPFR